MQIGRHYQSFNVSIWQAYKKMVQQKLLRKMAYLIVLYLCFIIMLSVISQFINLQKRILKQSYRMNTTSLYLTETFQNRYLLGTQLFLNRTRQILHLNLKNIVSQCDNISFYCNGNHAYTNYYSLLNIQYQKIISGVVDSERQSLVFLLNIRSQIKSINNRILNIYNGNLLNTIKNKILQLYNKKNSYLYLSINQSILVSCLNHTVMSFMCVIDDLSLLFEIPKQFADFMSTSYTVWLNNSILYGNVTQQFNSTVLYQQKLARALLKHIKYLTYNGLVNIDYQSSNLDYLQFFYDCFQDFEFDQQYFYIQCNYGHPLNQIRSKPLLIIYRTLNLPSYYQLDSLYTQVGSTNLKLSFMILPSDHFYNILSSDFKLADQSIFFILNFGLILLFAWSLACLFNRLIIKSLIKKLLQYTRVGKDQQRKNQIDIIEVLNLVHMQKKVKWVIKYQVFQQNTREKKLIGLKYDMLKEGLQIFLTPEFHSYILEQLIKCSQQEGLFAEGYEALQKLICIKLQYLKNMQNGQIDYKLAIQNIYRLQLDKFRFLYERLKKQGAGQWTQTILTDCLNRLEQYENTFQLSQELQLKSHLQKYKIHSLINIPINYYKIQQLQYSANHEISSQAKYLMGRQLFKHHPFFDLQAAYKLYLGLTQSKTTEDFKNKTLKMLSNIFQKYPRLERQTQQLNNLADHHNSSQKLISIIIEFTQCGSNYTAGWNKIMDVVRLLYTNMGNQDSIQIASVNSSHPKLILPQCQKSINEQQIIDMLHNHFTELKNSFNKGQGSKRTKSITQILLIALRRILQKPTTQSKYVVIILQQTFSSNLGDSRQQKQSKKKLINGSPFLKEFDQNLVQQTYFHLLLVANKSQIGQLMKWGVIKRLRNRNGVGTELSQIDLKVDTFEEMQGQVCRFYGDDSQQQEFKQQQLII